MLQRQSSLFDAPTAEPVEDGIAGDLNALTYQDSVLDIPLTTTKAALYVFLNAMVSPPSSKSELILTVISFVEGRLQMIPHYLCFSMHDTM